MTTRIATRAAVLLAALASCSVPTACVAPARRVVRIVPADREPDLKVDPTLLIEQVVEAHNRTRVEEDLPPLRVSNRLREAAERHARDMAERGKMGHTGGDGTSPMDRIEQAGYRYRRAGENVAHGRFTTQELMQGWLDSPGHRKNILGGFSEIGVARAEGGDGTSYWCVTFGLPARR